MTLYLIAPVNERTLFSIPHSTAEAPIFSVSTLLYLDINLHAWSRGLYLSSFWPSTFFSA